MLPVKSPNKQNTAKPSYTTLAACEQLSYEGVNWEENRFRASQTVIVTRIKERCSNRENDIALQTKEKQKHKIERLSLKHKPPWMDIWQRSSQTWTADLSEWTRGFLSASASQTVMRQIPQNAIIAATEATCKQLKSREAKPPQGGG